MSFFIFFIAIQFAHIIEIFDSTQGQDLRYPSIKSISLEERKQNWKIYQLAFNTIRFSVADQFLLFAFIRRKSSDKIKEKQTQSNKAQWRAIERIKKRQ